MPLQLDTDLERLQQALQKSKAKEKNVDRIPAPPRDPLLPTRRSTRAAAHEASRRLLASAEGSPQKECIGHEDESFELDIEQEGKLLAVPR